jgi:hypothetical protein
MEVATEKPAAAKGAQKKKTASSSSTKVKGKPKATLKPKVEAKSKAAAAAAASAKKTSSAAAKKTADSKAKEKEAIIEASSTTPGDIEAQSAKATEVKEGSSSTSEVRGAIFRKAPSKKVIDKKKRALSQRMMLISRERCNGTSSSSSSSSTTLLGEDFKVLGSTGNVYSVVIDSKPRCDCPDARKNPSDICKHLIFVFLKVLKLPEDIPYWFQKSLLPSELSDLFARAKPDPTLTNAKLQSAYLVATGQKEASDATDESSSSSSHGRRNIPQPGDGACCPICYEDFVPGEIKGLVFCETSCGNPVHDECLKQWRKSCQASAATCVWCRTVLSQEKENVPSGPLKKDEFGMQYVNLANDTGIDPNRDYSSYSRSCECSSRYRDWL